MIAKEQATQDNSFEQGTQVAQPECLKTYIYIYIYALSMRGGDDPSMNMLDLLTCMLACDRS